MPQNEKHAKPIGGPGGRSGHGPRPNVKNPGKLFMRLLSYIMKNYAVHCVIVVICIFITVLASVQGTWFMQTLIDGYITAADEAEPIRTFHGARTCHRTRCRLLRHRRYSQPTYTQELWSMSHRVL